MLANLKMKILLKTVCEYFYLSFKMLAIFELSYVLLSQIEFQSVLIQKSNMSIYIFPERMFLI